jgi:hypothetical protein
MQKKSRQSLNQGKSIPLDESPTSIMFPAISDPRWLNATNSVRLKSFRSGVGIEAMEKSSG